MNPNEKLLEEMLEVLHRFSENFEKIRNSMDLAKIFDETEFAVYSVEKNKVKLLNDAKGFPAEVNYSSKKGDNALSNVAKKLGLDPEENLMEFVLWEKDFRLLFIRKLTNKDEIYHTKLAWTFFGTIKNFLGNLG